MEPAATAWVSCSVDPSLRVSGQASSPAGNPNRDNSSLTAVHCSPPICTTAKFLFGGLCRFKNPSCAVIPGSGRKHWLPFPYSTYLSLHSMWASILTLGPSWVTETCFSSFPFLHIAIFQDLGIKSWRSSAVHHSTIFLEVLMLCLALIKNLYFYAPGEYKISLCFFISVYKVPNKDHCQ